MKMHGGSDLCGRHRILLLLHFLHHLLHGRTAHAGESNLISGLMITAVAGGGAVTPLIGAATDAAGITAGVCVLLICAFYLTFCAYGVKSTR